VRVGVNNVVWIPRCKTGTNWSIFYPFAESNVLHKRRTLLLAEVINSWLKTRKKENMEIKESFT